MLVIMWMCAHLSIGSSEFVPMHVYVHAWGCVKVWVEPVHTCVYVCVPMWFLARASTEIGLPVGAVCRESGKAEGKLNNSTFLKLEWGVWRWVLLNLALLKNEVKQKWSRLSCIFVGLYLSNCKKQNLGFKINLRFLMWQWSWLQLNPCVSGLSNESI